MPLCIEISLSLSYLYFQIIKQDIVKVENKENKYTSIFRFLNSEQFSAKLPKQQGTRLAIYIFFFF